MGVGDAAPLIGELVADGGDRFPLADGLTEAVGDAAPQAVSVTTTKSAAVRTT